MLKINKLGKRRLRVKGSLRANYLANKLRRQAFQPVVIDQRRMIRVEIDAGNAGVVHGEPNTALFGAAGQGAQHFVVEIAVLVRVISGPLREAPP
jgi:hypothetical protein